MFYISSSIIKEPNTSLVLSSSLRVAFSSFLKSYSLESLKNKVSCINIAPGPTKTTRVKELITDIKSYEKKLPLKHLCNPDEIGKFVRFVVKNKIISLNGTTITFDSNLIRGL